MKNFNPKYSILTLVVSLLFSVQDLFADNQHPPAPRGNEGFDTGVVVGGPIDDYLPLLFFVAILLGTWAINRYKKIELAKA